VDQGSQLVTDLQGNLENMASQAADQVMQMFTELVTNALGDAFAPLQQGFSFFQELTGTMTDLLDGGIGEVVDAVKEITDIVEAIEPVINIVRELLG
jgi:hypothetical protein